MTAPYISSRMIAQNNELSDLQKQTADILARTELIKNCPAYTKQTIDAKTSRNGQLATLTDTVHKLQQDLLAIRQG
jgi:hypothetical protein